MKYPNDLKNALKQASEIENEAFKKLKPFEKIIREAVNEAKTIRELDEIEEMMSQAKYEGVQYFYLSKRRTEFSE